MTAFRRFGLFFPVWLMMSCTPLVKEPGPALVPARLEADAVMTADGARLPLRSWLPEADGPPRAVVLALHGMNDYANSFEEPGRYLAERGIAVYAYDQRGFGQGPERGYWAGSRALARDAQASAGLLAVRYPGTPLFLLGESMGGAVVVTALAGPNPPPYVAGAILSAPAVWDRGAMPFYQRAALWLASRLAPGMRLGGEGLNIRPSDNDAMLEALSRDPLIIKRTRVDVIHGVCDLMDEASLGVSDLHLPVLMLYGENDQVVPAEPSARAMRTLTASPGVRTVAVYRQGWHMLLRDLQAEIVMADIAAWIEAPERPLPSEADRRADDWLEETLPGRNIGK